MGLRSGVVALAVAGSLAFACGGGPHLERHHADHPSPSASAIASASAALSASASASAREDEHRALHITYAAIGCFTGGAWVEALGAIGEERTLATTGRCRMLATDALGAKPEDEAALVAARSIEPNAVEKIVGAVARDPDLVALVRAVASAAREASEARRAAEAVRKDPKANRDDALVAKQGLAQLHALKAGRHTATARLVALVLAADHVDSARGLPTRAKVLAASPAFEVIFNVPRPNDAEAWVAYVSAAAKAGGHPPSDSAEQSAFASVVTSFADKFEAMVKDAPVGEPQDVAAGYAKRLRTELAETAKKNGK